MMPLHHSCKVRDFEQAGSFDRSVPYSGSCSKDVATGPSLTERRASEPTLSGCQMT